MARRSIEYGDRTFADDVTFGGTVGLPSGSVTNEAVANGANLDGAKLQPTLAINGADNDAETTAAFTCTIHLARQAGTIEAFEVGHATPCVGDSTVTVDLQNESDASLLSSTITLDSGNSAHVAEAGSIGSNTLADGDILRIVVTVSAGTGTLGSGLFWRLSVNETGI